MTVSAETPIASSVANGVTTVFPYAFTVLLAGDLVVQGVLAGVTTVYTLGVDYTLTGVGASAGSVVFGVAPANGTVITRYRVSSIERSTDYQDNGDLLADTVNNDFDRLWFALQDITSGSRGNPTAIRLPDGETTPPLPAAAARAGFLLGFDAVTGAVTMVTAAAGSALALALALASSIGSALLGFIQNATGAVVRTVQAKLREIKGFTPQDFGAVGDGVANDRAALVLADTAAVAAGRDITLPAGTYLISSDLTIASPCYFEVGAVIRVATGVTLLFTQPATERWAIPRKIFDCVGTGKVQWTGCSPTVYPDWWVTNATPATTDMYVGLQAAADCVVNGADAYCPSKTTGGAGRCTILLVTKRYRTTAVLDWTQRDWMQVQGVGRAEILSESTGYIADFSSTYHVVVNDVTFTSYTARVGLLFNRCTSNPFCVFTEFNRVNVYVGTNPSFNGGTGSIGVVNCRAEQNVWNNCDFYGDVTRYMTQTFNASYAPVSGTQDNTITSLVIATFNQCNFRRHTKHIYGHIIDGAIGWKDINCYWSTVSTASGSTEFQFLLENLSGFEISGVMENTAGFAFVRRYCYFGKLDFTPQAAAMNSTPVFSFDSAFNTGFIETDMVVNITSVIASGRVIRWSGSGPNFRLHGCTLKTGGPALIRAVDVNTTAMEPFGIEVVTEISSPVTVASGALVIIEPGTKSVFISGTAAIDIIGATGFAGKTVVLIPTAAWTTTTAGNIATAITAAANVPRIATYDGTAAKWYIT